MIKKGEDYCLGHTGRKECFFLFSSQDANRRSLEPLQRSLISQLCTPTSVIEQLQLLYSECHKTYPPRKPSKSELTNVLTKTLQSLEEDVFVFVDALDEVLFDDRPDVTSFLEALQGLGAARLHLFVTSRNEPDIEQALSYPIRWTEQAMEENPVNSDIDLHVSRFLESSARFKNQAKETKELIRQRLVAQGGSM